MHANINFNEQDETGQPVALHEQSLQYEELVIKLAHDMTGNVYQCLSLSLKGNCNENIIFAKVH